MFKRIYLLILFLLPLASEAKIITKSSGIPGQNFKFQIDKAQQIFIETSGDIDTYLNLTGEAIDIELDDDIDDSANERFSKFLPAGVFNVFVGSNETGNYNIKIYSQDNEKESLYTDQQAVTKILPDGKQNKIHLREETPRFLEFESGSGYAVIESHGNLDTQLTLYKITSRGEKIKLEEDDDGGKELNAKIERKIRKGKYIITIKSNSENTDDHVYLSVLVDQPKCLGKYLVGQHWDEKIDFGNKKFICREINGKPKVILQATTCNANYKEINGECRPLLCENKYKIGQTWKENIEGGYKEYQCQDSNGAVTKLINFICADAYERKSDSCVKRPEPKCDGIHKIGELWKEQIPGGEKTYKCIADGKYSARKIFRQLKCKDNYSRNEKLQCVKQTQKLVKMGMLLGPLGIKTLTGDIRFSVVNSMKKIRQ